MNPLSASQKNTLLIVGGLLAGVMNGLLGAGGGILLVYILSLVLPRETDGESKSPDKRDVFANAIATMLPITAVSVISYASRGTLKTEGAAVYIFPAVIGGLCGAWLLSKLRFETVRKLFSFIVILSGIVMLLRD